MHIGLDHEVGACLKATDPLWAAANLLQSNCGLLTEMVSPQVVGWDSFTHWPTDRGRCKDLLSMLKEGLLQWSPFELQQTCCSLIVPCSHNTPAVLCALACLGRKPLIQFEKKLLPACLTPRSWIYSSSSPIFEDLFYMWFAERFLVCFWSWGHPREPLPTYIWRSLLYLVPRTPLVYLYGIAKLVPRPPLLYS